MNVKLDWLDKEYNCEFNASLIDNVYVNKNL